MNLKQAYDTILECYRNQQFEMILTGDEELPVFKENRYELYALDYIISEYNLLDEDSNFNINTPFILIPISEYLEDIKTVILSISESHLSELIFDVNEAWIDMDY
jgi:hypothetical protein